MPAEGGYFARDWGAAGVLVTLLWLVAVVGGGRLLPPGREERIALGALAGLCALGFGSALWAQAPATAWEASSQFLTVVLSAWTLVLAPWRAGPAQLLFAGFGVAAAMAFAAALTSAAGAADLGEHFIDGRWAQPIGYPNALGNFGFFAALPMLAVSAAPRRHPALKAAALALATFLAGCALLPQSRGAVLAVAASAAVLVALSPGRWRMVVRLAVVAAALGAFSGPILGLYDAAREGAGVGAALDDALRAILLATLLAGAGGAALAVAETRVRAPERLARRAGAGALIAVLLAGAAAAAVNADRIDRFVERQREAWAQPSRDYDDRERAGSRLLSSDPLQRYQYWHVALDAFAARPLAGVGAGGFEARYTLERSEAKYSAFPHSLVLRVLAETGLLGAAGLLAFLAAALFGLLRGVRAAGDEARLVVAGTIAAGLCFLLHAQLDWLEEFPVLSGPAVGFVLVAMAVRRGPSVRPVASRREMAAAGVIAVLALAALVPPYLALRYQERATVVWRSDAQRAYRDLERAAALNPLSGRAALTEGVIALQRREYGRARAAFERAVERDAGWLGHFELALTLAARGDREPARRQLDRAAALNPREPAIAAARAAIARRERIDPVALNRELFESPLFTTRRLT